MRRDMDLIRQMLRRVSESYDKVEAVEFERLHYSHEIVGYHIRLLGESGLADVTVQPGGDDPYYYACINRLTWDGHEYIDAIANDTVWHKVRRELVKVGGGATFDIVKQVAVREVMQRLGLS